MRIQTLTIKDLRCIRELELRADDRLNVLLGANAQGKSTVLESIFLVCTSKSFRTGYERELISFDSDTSYISVSAHRDAKNPVRIELALTKNGPRTKSLRINGANKSRISDLFGELNCVVFSSEDVALLKGEPKIRRRYLNLDIAQLYPSYAVTYGEYKAALNQRNDLLKKMAEAPGSYPEDVLDAYDARLSGLGADLIARRLSYTDTLFRYAGEFYRSVIDSEKAEFRYRSTVDCSSADREDIEKAMLRGLKEKRTGDVITHSTGTGPHRDDITAAIDGRPVKSYGSAGQQRCCALALKLAQIYLYYDITGEYPIVLLDDFSSELDKERQQKLLSAARSNCQCFVTSTHMDREEDGTVFGIEKGRLL